MEGVAYFSALFSWDYFVPLPSVVSNRVEFRNFATAKLHYGEKCFGDLLPQSPGQRRPSGNNVFVASNSQQAFRQDI